MLSRGRFCELGLGIEVAPVVQRYKVPRRHRDLDRAEIPVDARKAREEGRLRADRSELLAPTQCRLVTEVLIPREVGHRRTGVIEVVVDQHVPEQVRDD